ncbi:hypothetical protein [Paraburkholderia saeva]|uniref:Uncharacterized protein n=1 Tax=Paraburkholderia saeva TaxID=2777537 RepID=A0A9N8X2N6_9BURK|nr:hypothetical protein [Paraburkholderia saeva]CAG4906394.1 hypothetical protein LMG31841_03554 [Paraburkholderia saeva]
MALPELAGWRAEAVRATFIANAPVTANGKGWWQAFTGTAPDTVLSKPNAAEHSESGPFGVGRLEMKVAFNRVDWVYMPIAEPGPSVPSLGEAQEIMPALNEALAAWLASDDTPFVRTAYGAGLLYPASDVIEGNRAMLAYLPFISMNPELGRDLFFQTNFPRPSSVLDGGVVNRISKLMSATAQVINIGGSGPVPTIQSHYFARVELDLSTTADRTETIPVDKRSTAFNELVTSAIEMMTHGVQP